MGGDLKTAAADKAPTFLVTAMKDPEGGNLDRIQIVKGWVDAQGARQEKVYDVAWSGDRKPGADGKLPAVGNTVDVANATYTNSIGSAQLAAVWKDPDFDRRPQSGLLHARARDSDSTLDRVRRQALQREDGEGRADDHAGARLYVAHLVHAVTSPPCDSQIVPQQAREQTEVTYSARCTMRVFTRLTTTSILGLVAASALAQTPIVYPAKGQSAEQQQKDTGECAAWAKETTGIDPAALAAAPAPAAAPAAAPAQPESKGAQGERVKGAARGAAAGAVVGEIANDDAGEGAAVGAAAGAVAAGSRSRRDRRQQEEQGAQQQEQATAEQKAAQEQAEAKKQEQLATYNRASAACLEGRGYVLK